ncbi:MAG: ATP phosphoribosyltransferase [Spirochaetales bacterium]|nr:ATP phosphoribosyltransferase [Spirochaetales bacterium]
MEGQNRGNELRIGIPKGRMQAKVVELFNDAGIPLSVDEREYRPRIGNGKPATTASRHITYEAKLLKPQNILEMLASGSRDIGFAGADWVRELGVDVVELLDTGLDPVTIVAAMPESLAEAFQRCGGSVQALASVCGRTPIVASEYETIARQWIEAQLPGASFVRSYGATEVFPPEDADIIIDNAATGTTLRANKLAIVDTIMTSSTRLFASRSAMANPVKRDAADALILLFKSVLEARRRVMLEVNISAELLEGLVSILPCLRAPTIAPLGKGDAFAVKVAAPREMLASLIPEIKRRGGTDIVVTEMCQLVP